MRAAASLLFALVLVTPATALAQGDDAPEDKKFQSDDDEVLPDDIVGEKPLEQGAAAQLGIGLRMRYVFMPEGMLELFLEDAPSGMAHVGFGLEIVRRKGNFDIVVGLEYENIAPDDGLYLESGDVPGTPGGGMNPDETEFDSFALLGADVSFIWHAQIVPKVDFRYGAGIGIGAVLGSIYQTDTNCSVQGDINSCTPITGGGGDIHVKNEDVPPVVPIVNVLIGTRIEVAPQLTLNIEGGFRDVFYLGAGTTYLF